MNTLELKAPHANDLDCYHEIFSDPQTHAYIIDEGLQNRAGSSAKLAKLIEMHGVSKKVYTLVSEENAVGFIVIHLDNSPRPFISYAIKRSAQRRGFTSLGITCFLDLERQNFQGFRAATHLSNLPSQMLLRKKGFKELGVQQLPMGQRLVFDISL